MQPIPRYVYEDATLNNYELVPQLTQLSPDDWDAFHHTVVRPNTQVRRQRGQYAAEARKRARSGGSGKAEE